MSYWGGYFPEQPDALSYWGGYFPEGAADVGLGDPGVAAFKIVLDVGSQLTLTWETHIHKARDGSERRASNLPKPKQRYSGPMLLVGTEQRVTRTQLAQYAHLGFSFLIGLSYEAVPILAAATQSESAWVLSIPSTASIDWAGVGQRVLLDRGSESVEAVIVDVGANSISIDTDPGSAGNTGGIVMPAMPSLLEPQQAFARYQRNAETWQVTARASLFDYADFEYATLSLAATDVLAGAELHALEPGTEGNTIAVTFDDDGTGTGSIDTAYTGSLYGITVHFEPGVTTVADVVALIETSTLIGIRGSYTGTDVLTASDVLALSLLAGGTEDYGSVGKSATVDTFRSVPVWDRGITVDGTAQDSIQSMHDVEDLGGVPFAVGAATVSDWGRALVHRRALADRDEWQWLLKFLDTVKGHFLAFYLATYAEDMTSVSASAGTLVVESDDGLATWFPSQRDSIRIEQEDGTVTYARVTAIADNGDGTTDVSIVDESDVAVTLSASAVRLVSWLELCHLESDEVSITFEGGAFAMETQARVVQR